MFNITHDVVAVTGSPSNDLVFSFHVLEPHMRSSFRGRMIKVPYQINTRHGLTDVLVIGQVNTIELSNAAHESTANQVIIKQDGRVDQTETGDYMLGSMEVKGAYEKVNGIWKKTLLGVPPLTGTPMYWLDEATARELMAHESNCVFIGRLAGTDIPAPVYNYHFGNVNNGGLGESRNITIFGQSGSGKSAFATFVMSSYVANPQMGMVILDPQSQVVNNDYPRNNRCYIDFDEMLQKASKDRFNPKKHKLNICDIKFEGERLFVQLLKKFGFFAWLGVDATIGKEDNINRLARSFEAAAEQQPTQGKSFKPDTDWIDIGHIQVQEKGDGGVVTTKPFPEFLRHNIAALYADSRGRKKTIEAAWQDNQSNLEAAWNQAASLFKDADKYGLKRHRISDILEAAMLRAKIYIIDLVPRGMGDVDDDLRTVLVNFVFRGIHNTSQTIYSNKNSLSKMLGTPIEPNCLVVLDEAGRFAPQDKTVSKAVAQLGHLLAKMAAQTRKTGVGLCFINQGPSGMDKEILRNSRIRIYGTGLGIGADADNMAAMEPCSEAMDLYRALPDPKQSGVYSFMISGDMPAMGNSGKPMVIEAFSTSQEFYDNNPHIFGKKKLKLTGKKVLKSKIKKVESLVDLVTPKPVIVPQPVIQPTVPKPAPDLLDI